MKNIKINERNRTIEVTKGFLNKARMYGTDEYNELKEVRNDFPGFKVITRNSTKNRDGFKGLTLKYMENYTKEHSKINLKNE